ncbi:unnamed protein product [Cuscuta epithymum]|uniref:Uncharacterized protein n=1 Tax=Cuscuta epithymum TaxID=186058 RepID=A0AAV0GJJ1_9ASTE|nr:unnamed protein product [Cuscuta epithymum]
MHPRKRSGKSKKKQTHASDDIHDGVGDKRASNVQPFDEANLVDINMVCAEDSSFGSDVPIVVSVEEIGMFTQPTQDTQGTTMVTKEGQEGELLNQQESEEECEEVNQEESEKESPEESEQDYKRIKKRLKKRIQKKLKQRIQKRLKKRGKKGLKNRSKIKVMKRLKRRGMRFKRGLHMGSGLALGHPLV